MSTGFTVTCEHCGGYGFIVINRQTGQMIDLHSYFRTLRTAAVSTNLRERPALDIGDMMMVCANPKCRKALD